jgi:hypothetical protein
MLFRIDDLKYEKDGRCAYRASAGKVRCRLDECGITFDFCRRVYEDLATTPVPSFVPYADDSQVFDPKTPFPTYCQRLLDVWRKYPSVFSLAVSKSDSDAAARLAVGAAFATKDDDNQGVFTEAETLIFIRTIIELIPARTILELDLTELVFDYGLGKEWAEGLMQKWRRYLYCRTAVEYKLYGFALTKDPQVRVRLKARIESLDEDGYLDRVLVPVLTRCGFERVQRVRFHGMAEFGRDIMPFRQKTPLGTYEYSALQAKAVRIHGRSRQSGNVAELISQAMAAFSVRFIDDLDNECKRIDRFVVACNHEITPDARRIIEGALEGNRRLVFLDLSRTVELVCQHNLAAYVLFGEEPQPSTRAGAQQFPAGDVLKAASEE